MTRLLRRTPYRGKHRAEDLSNAPLRAARGRRRAERAPRTHRPGSTSPRWRRRVPYAAAGLIALTGAVAPLGQSRPAPRAVAAVTEEPANDLRMRPAAVRPAAVRVYPRATATPRPKATARPPARASRSRTSATTFRGRATWYGPGFAGRRTASGEVFRPYSELTAAHRWLPFGTRLRVCRRERCVVVRVNDRGPFGNAILDLSWLAAERIGMVNAGIVPVTATVVRSGA